jgi:hypothetical protein
MSVVFLIILFLWYLLLLDLREELMFKIFIFNCYVWFGYIMEYSTESHFFEEFQSLVHVPVAAQVFT